jgi:hypothetical protein
MNAIGDIIKNAQQGPVIANGPCSLSGQISNGLQNWVCILVGNLADAEPNSFITNLILFIGGVENWVRLENCPPRFGQAGVVQGLGQGYAGGYFGGGFSEFPCHAGPA